MRVDLDIGSLFLITLCLRQSLIASNLYIFGNILSVVIDITIRKCPFLYNDRQFQVIILFFSAIFSLASNLRSVSLIK